jgi:hypothetical protein
MYRGLARGHILRDRIAGMNTMLGAASSWLAGNDNALRR